MAALEELAQLVAEKSRRVFVAEAQIDLSSTQGTNSVYVFQLPTEALGAAGGRVGGIGERKLAKLYYYRQEQGRWTKVYESDNEQKLERFELPYHAAGLAVIMPDGSERVVSGVIDPELIHSYNQTV